MVNEIFEERFAIIIYVRCPGSGVMSVVTKISDNLCTLWHLIFYCEFFLYSRLLCSMV